MMARFVRWTTGIVSRVDHLITQVENHDALAQSALRRIDQGVGRARVQLRRVERDGAALVAAVEKQEDAARRWKARAVAEADDERAIECLRRAKRAEMQSEELRSRLESHGRAEKALRRELALLQERAVELKRQRNELRTRQSQADARLAIESSDTEGVEGVFERWEIRLAEIAPEPCDEELDRFEAEIECREEAEALRKELAELRGRS